MFASLRSRLLLLLLLIALPAFGLTLNAYLTIYRQGLARIEQNARDLVQLAAKDQETVTAEARLLLRMLAQMPVMRDPQQSAACHQILANLLRQQPGYANLGVADREGNLYCNAISATDPINVSDRSWFAKAAAGHDFVISDYQIGRISGKPGIAFGYPLRGPDGEFQGALFASSDLSWLQRLVAAVQLPGNSTAVVMDPDGRILARFPDPGSWVGKILPDTALARLVRAQPGPGFTELPGIDEVQRFYAYTPLASADGGVYLLVGLSPEAALSSLYQTLTYLLLLGLLTLTGLTVAWWAAGVLLMRPIARLADAAHQMGSGDFSAGWRLNLDKGANELHNLAASFHAMAVALEQQDTARQAAAERFQRLFDAAPLPLCSLSQDGTLLYINDRFIKTFGYTLAEVPTLDHWWQWVCPDPNYRRWAAATWEGTVRYHRWAATLRKPGMDDAEQLGVDLAPFEYQIVSKNGQIRQMEISGAILGDEALALFMDVTERRQAEADLRRREQEFKNLAEHSPDLIARFDRQLRHLYVSPLILAVTGREPAEFIGKTYRELGFDPTLVEPWDAALQQVIATGQEQQIEFSLPASDGSIQYFESRLAPEFAPDRTVASVLGVTRNITARRRAAAERELLQQQLIDASRLAGMTEVATGVLHNVGNVLNSVNVSVHLMSDTLRASRVANLGKTVQLLRENLAADGLNSNERGRHLLDYLTALADHLRDEQQQLYAEAQTVADKIEHIKRIVSRQQAYTVGSGINEPVVLPQLLDDALAMHIADHHAIAVLREYQPLPPQVLDKHKLLQIVANLVRNAKDALKEQEGGDRRLITRLHRSDRRFQIEIADNGVGIAAEHLSRVFEFGFTTKPDGHGFGLHISANLARELGGHLSCHSDSLGQGTVFTLDLPCRPLNIAGERDVIVESVKES